MKTVNNWEFKYLGHVKYLCANLSIEPFYIPFVKMNFFSCTLVTVFLALLHYFFNRLPFVLVNYCGSRRLSKIMCQSA